MRILLIGGVNRRLKRYGDYNVAAPKPIPYSLLCLAAVLQKIEGIEVDIFDLEIESSKNILDKIKSYNPDVIGMTIYSIDLEDVYSFINRIKEKFPEKILVAGGPHITLYPGNLIKNSSIDYCISGEGEYAFTELIKNINSGKPVNDIKNLLYRKSDKIVYNPDRNLIEPLDKLPFPAFELIKKNIEKYYPQPMSYRKRPVVNIVTSRGCPHNCEFCPSPKLWNGTKWRANSAEYVVNFMEHLIKNFNIKEIYISDASFTVSKRRVMEICRLIISRKLKIIWTADLNLRDMNEELADLMKKAGCWLISCGIESGDDRILKSINKPLTIKETSQKIEMINMRGIKVRGYFMIGHREDTERTIKKTIKYSQRLPLYSANFSISINQPGYNFVDREENEDRKRYEILSYSAEDNAGLSNKRLPVKYLTLMQKQAFVNFFLRPSQILKILSSIRSIEDIKRYSLMLYGGINLIIKSGLEKM